MAEEEWSGFDDGDMVLDFSGRIFRVPRAILAQSSPVWKSMLTGAFAESTGDTVRFYGDDPKIARLCIELIYSTSASRLFDWHGVENRVNSDRVAFDHFVDKYDLVGVKHAVEHMCQQKQHMLDEKQRLEHETLRLQREKRLVKHELECVANKRKRIVTQPGNTVNISEHRPEIGTRVRLGRRVFPSSRNARQSIISEAGTVIANWEDNGTRIGIRLDND